MAKPDTSASFSAPKGFGKPNLKGQQIAHQQIANRQKNDINLVKVDGNRGTDTGKAPPTQFQGIRQPPNRRLGIACDEHGRPIPTFPLFQKKRKKKNQEEYEYDDLFEIFRKPWPTRTSNQQKMLDTVESQCPELMEYMKQDYALWKAKRLEECAAAHRANPPSPGAPFARIEIRQATPRSFSNAGLSDQSVPFFFYVTSTFTLVLGMVLASPAILNFFERWKKNNDD